MSILLIETDGVWRLRFWGARWHDNWSSRQRYVANLLVDELDAEPLGDNSDFRSLIEEAVVKIQHAITEIEAARPVDGFQIVPLGMHPSPLNRAKLPGAEHPADPFDLDSPTASPLWRATREFEKRFATHVYEQMNRSVPRTAQSLEISEEAVRILLDQSIDPRLFAMTVPTVIASLARNGLTDVRDNLSAMSLFVKGFQDLIQHNHDEIEKLADQYSQLNRASLRNISDQLANFAQRYDMFQALYAPRDAAGDEFSPPVYYVRGVAAYYQQQPEVSRTFLGRFLARAESQATEIRDLTFLIGIAHYYLGMINASFGNYDLAISSLAILASREREVVAPLVMAEIYAMKGDNAAALEMLHIVEVRLPNEQYGHETPWSSRLRSKALLVRANLLIVGRTEGWQLKVARALASAVGEDQHNYEAKVTLAQVLSELDESDGAAALFGEAYAEIVRSGRIQATVEWRSRIRILMTAAICCRYRDRDTWKALELLREARARLGDLPTLDGKVCLVYSALSKLNVHREVIERDLDAIASGHIFLA